ncbi:MAG: Ig-like domain repeat protein, partial [Chloroflexi bacterium]|nr:Ig-like domain repeat protein [Chloroflexota bacterium]
TASQQGNENYFPAPDVTQGFAITSVQQGQTVVAWGWNGSGQTNVPVGLNNVIAVSAGLQHNLALKSDGTVVAWGDNVDGELDVPVGLNNVIAISAGRSHSLALKSDGTVVAWGWNQYGPFIPPPVGLSNVIAISDGVNHSLALKSDGTVVAWGNDSFGQSNVPAGLSGVVAISAGSVHSLALKSDGTVVAWGYNFYGQSNVPAGLNNVIAISDGVHHSMALKSDGTVVAWGHWLPAELSGVIAISAGDGHSLALKSDGTLVAWGDNSSGQSNVPSGLSGVIAISAGGAHNLALSTKANSTINLISSPNPTYVGQSVTFTVTVTSGSGTPTGSVDFKEGATTLGSGTLDGSGVATFTTSSFGIGNHKVVAVYSGDSSYVGSTSVVVNQIVQGVGSKTTVTTAPNPSVMGQAISMTAKVTGDDGGKPTGDVGFMWSDGSTANIAGYSPLVDGVATYSLTGLPVGTYQLWASYLGNTHYADSTSSDVSQIISNKLTSVTTLTSSSNPSTLGQSVIFTATVTSSNGIPTGTVQFKVDGVNQGGTVNVAQEGKGSLAVPDLSVGTHLIMAEYSGDATYQASSTTFTQTVNKLENILTLVSSPNPSTVGQAVTLTATVTPATATGSITFKDGGSDLQTVALSGGVASFTTSSLGVGSHTLTASYGGDSNYNPSLSSAQTLTVVNPPNPVPVITSVSPISTTVQAVTTQITVTVTGSGFIPGSVIRLNGTDLATTYINPTTLSVVIPGAQLSTARVILLTVFNGTPGGGTSNPLAFYVTPVGTAVTSSSTATTAPGNTTATATTGGTGTLTPGNVTLQASGGSGTVSVAIYSSNPTEQTVFQSGTGFFDAYIATGSSFTGASLSLCNTGGGKRAYWYDGTAWQPASSQSFNPSTGCITVTVNATTSPNLSQLTGTFFAVGYMTTTTSLTASPNPSTFGQQVTFTATVTPAGGGKATGAVQFAVDGQTVGQAVALDSNSQATLSTTALTTGNHTITAVYSGSDYFSGSTSEPVSQLVNQPSATATTLVTDPAQGTFGGTVELKATLTANDQPVSGKSISFKLNGQPVCGGNNLPPCPTTTATGVATLSNVSLIGIDAGTYNSWIAASFTGDSTYAASSGTGSLTVNAAATTTTLASSAASPVYGQVVNFTATVSGPGAPIGTFSFSLDGVDQGTVSLNGGTASFTPAGPLAVGSHSLKATFNDGNNYASSSATLSNLVVSKATTALKLTSDNNPSMIGTVVNFTAQVSVVSPGDGVPTGSITFSLDNGAITGTASMDNSGAATFSTDKLTVGSHTVVASYGSDTSFGSSYDQLSQTVTNLTPGLAVNNTRISYGGTATLTALLNSNKGRIPGKTISFSVNGKAACNSTGLPNCPQTASNGVATLKLNLGTAGVKQVLGDLLPGNYPITARFAGESAYPAATGSATLVVTKLTAKVILGNLVQTYDGNPKYASVTTTPANLKVTVTYSQGFKKVAQPINAGWYLVKAVVNDPIYSGTASGILVINKAAATIKLDQVSLTQVYDGKPKAVKYTVTPNGIGLENQVVVYYNGSAIPPTRPGKYSLVAKLYSQNYTAPDATGTLVIQGIAPNVTTGEAKTISGNSSTLYGTVNANYATIKALYFQWGESQNSLTGRLAVSATVTGGNNKAVSTTLKGLQSGKTYYYRLVVEYSGGSSPVLGDVKSFTTM